MAAQRDGTGARVITGTMTRAMEIATPLGPDVLLFHRMRAREELGRLSHYQIGLLSAQNIDLNEVLGQSVSVRLALANDAVREFNGYVTAIAQHGTRGRYNRYTATVAPWFWLLTRSSDCRVFQDMTVRQIVEAVFEQYPADCQWELTGQYRERPYCVQYCETDFNFVSRLLEHEGIYYYFKHADSRSTMVLTDSYPGHDAFPGHSELPFMSGGRPGRAVEHIGAWKVSRHVQPGAYAHTDYDFERPQADLRTRATAAHALAQHNHERFDYPGHYAQRIDGERYAAVRVDEYDSQFETASGTTNGKGVAVGRLLKLAGHPRDDQNREYLITAATYDLEFSDYEAMPDRRGATYRCRFSAMPSDRQFRPRRTARKPSVKGVQTAVVVGPAGEEINTDAFGRITIQFHWDRYGVRDEHSSCWVRVSQFWAGNRFGALFIPRVGQEVVVDFIDGDPDRPIVVGSVYNGLHKPPYDLPEHKTQSGIRTRSTPNGSVNNCNEIRFEDKKDAEEFYVQAERTMTMRVKGSESHSVGGSRSLTVGGSQTTRIAQDHKVEVSEGSYNINVNQQHMMISVPEDTFWVLGKYINHVATDKFVAHVDRSTLNIWPAEIVADVLGNAIRIDPTSVSVTALAKISLTCGASKIELTPEGIVISAPGFVDVKGMPIKLNS